MMPVWNRYPALFSPAESTMQLYMWQHDIVGVAHCVMDGFDILMSLMLCLMLLMMHQPHLHQPWRLDHCNLLTHSLTKRLLSDLEELSTN